MKNGFKILCLFLLAEGLTAQVDFDPTTLPCGITTLEITYTDCDDWSGIAGVSTSRWILQELFPNGGVVPITDGEGSVEIEILASAPDSFELRIATFVVNDDPSNCMNQVILDIHTTEWFYTDCDPCSGFTASTSGVIDESCDGACDGEATADPSGGDRPLLIRVERRPDHPDRNQSL